MSYMDMDIFPKRPNEERLMERLMEFAIKMANDYLPKLGIPPEHYESALKAYVAGFFAGNGAQMGQKKSDRESN